MSNIALYLQPFLIALIFSLVFTKTLIVFGGRYKLFDPLRENKIHKRDVARFGGLGIILSFLVGMLFARELVFDSLKWGIVLSSVLIFVFGIYDDLKSVSWKKQLFVQVFVALLMIYVGLTVDYIANPLGGAEFRLDGVSGQIFGFSFSVLGSLFVLFWIVGLMNAMNWLDGLDGLSGGVGLIGAMTMFFLSVSSLVNQPPLGILAIFFAGSILGFLIFNFKPAKIFMGTSGSMFLGFMLAVLAIFSGGKIATVFLVLGFPILDTAFVIVSRLKSGNSPFQGDMRHFHYRLLQAGWSQKKVILFIYTICISFGISALIFDSLGKIISFLVLFFVMLGTNYFLKFKRNQELFE
ncbi:undecaprenyl/decaprenyl-phosphate alpha-N-acetylglucosaminyl 1-phosphate transferase [Candidatus Parcubacteria bacterium]|nr:undecaprenyl/decaprenyl-phosphate alpha-N-acetylglucosaminyl 1-phosphate transferase [Candidatus Parcubacteria bacterium]